MELAGWAPAINRWLDQTGTCHVLKITRRPRPARVPGTVGAACSYRGYLGGASWPTREACEHATGTHACKTCIRIEGSR